MKKTLLLLCLMAFFLTANAQRTYKLEGVIVDSASAKPVEFAAVGLWTDGKPVDGTLTDEKGTFKFADLKTGTYKLVISFVGYKPMSVENINLDENRNLGNVKLTGETQLLETVEVTAQAALIENRIDKMVYNADKDITNRGGTAEDVLRKVPMLTVDLDGNVTMRGSGNIRVLIDNKPSSIFASSVADALKQIPSDEIKAVEVITSPGAKYDGEGTAGIINIITKKNTLAGITGNISGGVGYLGSFGFGNLSLRDKKWGISLQGGGRYSYNVRTDGGFDRTSTVNGIPTFLTQIDDSRAVRNFSNYSATFDYDFTKNTNFSLAYRNRSGNSGSRGTTNITSLLGEERKLIRQIDRFVDNQRDNFSHTFDLTFLKKFEKPDQELTFLSQWSTNNRFENFDSEQNQVAFERSVNNGIDREITFQLDYVQPLTKSVKLEVGTKGILRKVTSDGEFSLFNSDLNTFVRAPARENFLNYFQNVVSGYTSFTIKLPKEFGLQAGVRYEKTIIDADFKDVPNADIPDYDNYLPSINLTKTIAKRHQLRASYTQRIQRPSIRFLNPFVDYSNPNSIEFGNPILRPELVDQFELNYGTFVKSNSFNISLYHRQTDNSISQIQDVIRVSEQDVTRSTYGNIGIDQNIGSNISLQLSPTKKLRIGGGFNVFYVYLNNQRISNDGFNFSYNANASYNFNNGWGAQFFGFMRSPSVTLQGIQGAFNFHTFSVKKDFKNKKGSLGLGVENPLARAIVIKSNSADFSRPESTFQSESVRNIYRRSIRVDFQYRFGKMDADGGGLFRRRKTVNNSDLKSGGDGEEGGGQGGGRQ